MSSIRKATEHDSYFLIDDGSGSPFKVAKSAISNGLADRIRRMYCGGTVKMAPGGIVDSVDDLEQTAGKDDDGDRIVDESLDAEKNNLVESAARGAVTAAVEASGADIASTQTQPALSAPPVTIDAAEPLKQPKAAPLSSGPAAAAAPLSAPPDAAAVPSAPAEGAAPNELPLAGVSMNERGEPLDEQGNIIKMVSKATTQPEQAVASAASTGEPVAEIVPAPAPALVVVEKADDKFIKKLNQQQIAQIQRDIISSAAGTGTRIELTPKTKLGGFGSKTKASLAALKKYVGVDLKLHDESELEPVVTPAAAPTQVAAPVAASASPPVATPVESTVAPAPAAPVIVPAPVLLPRQSEALGISAPRKDLILPDNAFSNDPAGRSARAAYQQAFTEREQAVRKLDELAPIKSLDDQADEFIAQNPPTSGIDPAEYRTRIKSSLAGGFQQQQLLFNARRDAIIDLIADMDAALSLSKISADASKAYSDQKAEYDKMRQDAVTLDAVKPEAIGLFGDNFWQQTVGLLSLFASGFAASMSGTNPSALLEQLIANRNALMQRSSEARRAEMSERYNNLRAKGVDVQTALKDVEARSDAVMSAIARAASQSNKIGAQHQAQLADLSRRMGERADKRAESIIDEVIADDVRRVSIAIKIKQLGNAEARTELEAEKFATNFQLNLARLNTTRRAKGLAPLSPVNVVGAKEAQKLYGILGRNDADAIDMNQAMAEAEQLFDRKGVLATVAPTATVAASTAPVAAAAVPVLAAPAAVAVAGPSRVSTVVARGKVAAKPAAKVPGKKAEPAKPEAKPTAPAKDAAAPAAAPDASAKQPRAEPEAKTPDDIRTKALSGYFISPREKSTYMGKQVGHQALSMIPVKTKNGTMYVYSAEKESKATKAYQEAVQLVQLMRELKNFVPVPNPSGGYDPPKRTRGWRDQLGVASGPVTSLKTKMDLMEKQVNGLGSYDAGVKDLFDKMYTSPQTLLRTNAATDWENYSDLRRRSFAALKIKMQGFFPAWTKYGREFIDIP